LQGVISSDTVTALLGTGAIASPNASDTPVAVTTNITLNGADAGNYELTAQPENVTVTISHVQLTINGVSAGNRVYDRTNIVTLTGGTLQGVVSGDTITPVLGEGTIENFNVGQNKTVITNITLSGDAASNYKLEQPNLSVNITPAPLTITGVSAVNRRYNGENTVELQGGTLDGIIDGDENYVSFDLGEGTMANASVGQSKAVTTSISLSGTAAGNYTLTPPSGITVNITTTAGITLDMNDFEITDLGNSQGRFTVVGTLSGAEPLTLTLTGSGLTVGEWRWGNIPLGSGNTITLNALQFGGNKGVVTLSVSFIEDGRVWLGSIEITVE
jgi:hypothetical protein